MHQLIGNNAVSLPQHVIDVAANTNRTGLGKCVHIVAVKHNNRIYKKCD